MWDFTSTYNLGQNILELYNVLVQIRLTTIKKNMIRELPHELPSNLNLRILGNKEILGKSEIWVET